MIVAADGGGDYRSIQAAIDALPADDGTPATIEVRPGTYREKLLLKRSNVRLIGSGAERTIVTYDDAATKRFPNGERYETFHSYTAYFGGDGMLVEGLTIANAAGPGDEVGQAVAAYADGDRQVFRRCRFVGSQDTLFTGPLPPAPVERAAFGGPGDTFPRRHVRQYYRDCYIEGDVDFIFGSATAVFRGCELFSRRRLPAGTATDAVTVAATGGANGTNVANVANGWIAAPSTSAEAEFGYVFVDCRVVGDAPPGSVYLGRPWREHAKAAYINCFMDACVAPEGWSDWSGRARNPSVRFREFGSAGPGAAPQSRVPWAPQLSETEAMSYAPARVLAGADGWDPEAESVG